MGSNQLTGWSLWLESNGGIRKFSVAEPERAEAERLTLARVPQATIIYRHELPNSVMVFLKAKRGQILEWVSAEPGKPLEPPLRHKAG